MAAATLRRPARPEANGWRGAARSGIFAAAGVLLATAGAGAAPVGPDVVVFSFTDVASYGSANGFSAYAIGTRSCNRGDVNLNWCDQASGCAPGATTSDHPVIAQNLYRLKDGRLQQIGMAWLKHGFLATNTTTGGCAGAQGQACTGHGTYGDNQLTVGCTDPYSTFYNGTRPLGFRHEVNAANGEFPMPPGTAAYSAVYDQRVKVANADVDPAQNAGATYFAEGQYVTPDDAASGNGFNNASSRPVTFGSGAGFPISMTGTFSEGVSAIQHWKTVDPTVEIVSVDVPGSSPVERYHVARKVTEPTPGLWHYEYAIHNLNSDRSARLFSVDLPDGTAITNAGFKDIDYHSGEVYTNLDWDITVDAPSGSVTWSTSFYSGGTENANALRWATMYNYWFDADAPPSGTLHELGLFKPGTPTSIDFAFDLFSDGFESNDMSLWSEHIP